MPLRSFVPFVLKIVPSWFNDFINLLYSDPLIDCTSNKRYSWMKGGVSWSQGKGLLAKTKGGDCNREGNQAADNVL